MKERELSLPSRKKNESCLDKQGWERQTTKPVAYNFGEGNCNLIYLYIHQHHHN